jgi:hypothetical protein
MIKEIFKSIKESLLIDWKETQKIIIMCLLLILIVRFIEAMEKNIISALEFYRKGCIFVMVLFCGLMFGKLFKTIVELIFRYKIISQEMKEIVKSYLLKTIFFFIRALVLLLLLRMGSSIVDFLLSVFGIEMVKTTTIYNDFFLVTLLLLLWNNRRIIHDF